MRSSHAPQPVPCRQKAFGSATGSRMLQWQAQSVPGAVASERIVSARAC
jgi:hypothetical protein